MSIKKVVLEKQTQRKVVKKFPEFDNTKIYVESDFFSPQNKVKQLVKIKNEFSLMVDGRSVLNRDTFKGMVNNRSTFYILNNQEELARFILGCREFPKVEEIEEVVEVPATVAEDEVYIDDISERKIYAFKCNADDSICKIHKDKDNDYWYAVGLDNSTEYAGVANTLKELIKLNNSEGDTVYQFDDQDEFIEWAFAQLD